MIPEIGLFSLLLALSFASAQVVLPWVGVKKHDKSLWQSARWFALAQFIFTSIAISFLAYSFLTDDFSVAYVAAHSNSHLPWFYKVCAVWGAHEGSMLLWVWVLTVWMTGVSFLSEAKHHPTIAWVLIVMALIAIGFYGFILFTSNPFIRLLPSFPTEGQSLNALLQDQGMMIHPPFLYMGYVGFSLAFAFAMAALIEGKLGYSWARWVRPWTLLAWCFLTYGIVAGSWWAYRQLGWGGWWFWDPVENASFMPWLAGTALIHSLFVVEKRDRFKGWAVVLALTTFSLSLLGTFLVRSGILISVHAFAQDPSRGQFLLLFFLLVVGISTLFYIFRAHTLSAPPEKVWWLSKEVFLLGNNLFLYVMMLTILLGTLYPLVLDELGLGKISVGYPYFNSVFIPLMVPFLLIMGVGPQVYWRETPTSVLWPRLGGVGVSVLAIATLAALYFPPYFSWGLWIGLVVVLWLFSNTAVYAWKLKHRTIPQWGMVLAHSGVAVTAMGIIVTTLFSQEHDVRMRVGETQTLGGYEYQWVRLMPLQGPNYSGVKAVFNLYQHGRLINTLSPEMRTYPEQHYSNPKAAIDVTLFRDIYVALGQPLGSDSWSLRVYYKPFIRWIWMGGLMMMIGGLMGFVGRMKHEPR